MKLSDLWPRAGAGKPATSVVSVTVAKRAGAELGTAQSANSGPRGPVELPATLAECEALEETLARDAIRLECQIGVAEGTAKAEGRYADPTWYHRAKAALKHINRDRQRLMVHLKVLRTEARRADPIWQGRDQELIRELKSKMNWEDFDECVRAVEARMEARR